MKPTKLILILLLGVTSFSCCKKDTSVPTNNNDYVPPNTMTAKINGTDWKNCGPPNSSSIMAQYFLNNYFDIEASSHCNGIDISVYMKIYSLNDTGLFSLGGITNNFGQIVHYKEGLTYVTNTVNTGTVKIMKFDTSNRKISGIFQFKAFNKDSNKVVPITEGQFINVYFYKF